MTVIERKLTKSRWRVTLKDPRTSKREKNFQLHARDLGGLERDQRVSAKTADRAVAELRRAKFERALNGGGVERGLSLLDLFDLRIQHLEALSETSPNTIEGFRQSRRRLERALGNPPVEELSRTLLTKTQDQLRLRGGSADEPLAPSTVNTTLAHARACWSWCETRGHVDRPWPRIPKLKPGPRTKRPYTDAEIGEVLAWVAGYRGGVHHPLVQLLADTGCRVSEVLGLRGRDIEREGREVFFAKTKTGDARTVPVAAETMAILPTTRAPDDYVFPASGKRGGSGAADPRRHLRRETVRKVLKKAVEALGIADPERLDTHSLRRSFCTTAERLNFPVDVARRVSGHKSRQMFEHYQQQAVGDDLHRVVEGVSGARSFPGRLPREESSGPARESDRLGAKDPVAAGNPGGPAGAAPPEPEAAAGSTARRARTSPTLAPQFGAETNEKGQAKCLALQSLRRDSNSRPHHYE